MNDQIIESVRQYYTEKIQQHGAVPAGVDWNGEESQTIRFEQLARIIPAGTELFSVLDYGCGYGAMFEFFKKRYANFSFVGFDISEEMIASARQKFPDTNAAWVSNLDEGRKCDFVVASGIFNVRLNATTANWEDYVLDTLHEIDRCAKRAFAFNVLSSYSDKDRMRDYLYYADPLALFDYCKQNFSRQVALLHDYPLYEFTMLVKKTD